MESARINPKNPQGDYLLRPTWSVAQVDFRLYVIRCDFKLTSPKGCSSRVSTSRLRRPRVFIFYENIFIRALRPSLMGGWMKGLV